MTDDRLTRDLADAADMAFPAAPALVPAVMAGLEQRRENRRRLIAAVAVAAVVVAVVLAFPAPREAIARLLGIGGVVVEQVDRIELPAAARTDVPLGRQVTLAEAAGTVEFPIRLPAEELDEPTMFLREDIAGGLVSAVYGEADELPGLILTQFQATREAAVKQVPPEVTTREVTITEGIDGLWIEGSHTIAFVDANGGVIADSARLVANTLLWEEGGVTIRIETLLPLEDALKIAAALR